jgi:hypothetical protein
MTCIMKQLVQINLLLKGGLLVLAFNLAACSPPATTAEVDPNLPSGPFLGMSPSDSKVLLAPNFISNSLSEYNGTFSPDGRAFFYTSEFAGKGHIVSTQMAEDGTWSLPRIVEFASDFSEYDPLFTPDGSRLYFSSERPLHDSAAFGLSHIWYLQKNDSNWSEPSHLTLTGTGDYFSSFNTRGTIYFNTWNDGKIWMGLPQGDAYKIDSLPSHIAGDSYVGDPFISPNDDFLIYRAYFQTGFGQSDLYISFKNDSLWSLPQNLGPEINTAARETCPSLSPDGKFFIWASHWMENMNGQDSLESLQEQSKTHDNGNSNIYYISADFIKELRKSATFI